MKSLIKIIKKYKFILFLITILVIKLIIVQVQPLNAKYTMKYDDQLMINMANNIMEGKWLGDYNSKTLIKGVFTPLFIVFMNILHVPFLMGKEIFYGIACIILILVLKKIVKNKAILSLIYIVLLMNPIEYCNELSRVYRDGIYIALLIYFLSFALAIFLNRKNEIKKQIKYFICFGLSFTAMYLCREENIWLLPFIVFMFFCTISSILLDKEIKNKFKRILLYLIPVAICLIAINIVCFINYRYYGVYTLNQYWGKPFKSAYGALTRIIPSDEIDRVPVTEETMQRLYKVSPKFAELEEFFEGKDGEKWILCGEHIKNEINGGYFHWALMDAVEQQGYYINARTSDKYYNELADEINNLCDLGKIEGRKNRIISNTCYFDGQDIIKVFKKLKDTIKYQYSLENVNMQVKYDKFVKKFEYEYYRDLFQQVTHQESMTEKEYKSYLNSSRLKTIINIEKIYKEINPYIFYISIIMCFTFFIININKIKEHYEQYVLLIGLIIIYISRVFVITFTHELMFKEALNVPYLSSIYNIQYLFSILAIVFCVKSIINKLKKIKA